MQRGPSQWPTIVLWTISLAITLVLMGYAAFFGWGAWYALNDISEGFNATSGPARLYLAAGFVSAGYIGARLLPTARARLEKAAAEYQDRISRLTAALWAALPMLWLTAALVMPVVVLWPGALLVFRVRLRAAARKRAKADATQVESIRATLHAELRDSGNATDT